MPAKSMIMFGWHLVNDLVNVDLVLQFWYTWASPQRGWRRSVPSSHWTAGDYPLRSRMMMMMIWALGRRNNEVVWRPYRLKMGDHLKMHKTLRRGCLAIFVDNIKEEALLCIT